MSILKKLTDCVGKWRGKSTLQDPNTNKPEESQSTAVVSSILGGRFIRLDYTWGYQGKPQEGSLLIGYDKDEDKVTAHWIDTWHNSDRVMACVGATPKDSTISVRGSYAAPPGPDWGWRIDIKSDNDQDLRIVMFNIWPEGKEELAMEGSYSRM